MSRNVIGNIVGAIIRVFVAVEDIFFDLVVRPLLMILYGVVKDTQWVEIIDRLFDLTADSWPPDKNRNSGKGKK